MQIVIDISKKLYDRYKEKDHIKRCDIDEFEKALDRSIIIPNGHGRLVDADSIHKIIKPIERTDTEWGMTAETAIRLIHEAVNRAPTIIEADRGMTIDNLCSSCTNIGCEFQSGIVRTKCAFYMPPQLEPDNCGNYVIQDSTTKNDLGVLDKIRGEIEQAADKQFQIAMGVADLNERYTHIQMESAYRHSLNIIDKYNAESEG